MVEGADGPIPSVCGVYDDLLVKQPGLAVSAPAIDPRVQGRHGTAIALNCAAAVTEQRRGCQAVGNRAH
jgi:hypothetical protein